MGAFSHIVLALSGGCGRIVKLNLFQAKKICKELLFLENLFWIGFLGAAIALVFALLQRNKVMKASEGDEKMVKIASAIRQGANAYLKRQYTTVAKVFVIVFIILLVIAFASGGQMLSRVTPFAFLTGGIWSMLRSDRHEDCDQLERPYRARCAREPE
jgi:hypothetical protein